jgi:hypothetical protein
MMRKRGVLLTQNGLIKLNNAIANNIANSKERLSNHQLASKAGISKTTFGNMRRQTAVELGSISTVFHHFGLKIQPGDWQYEDQVISLSSLSSTTSTNPISSIHLDYASSTLSPHIKLAQLLGLSIDTNIFDIYSRSTEYLLTEELKRVESAFKLGHNTEALNAISDMWNKIPRQEFHGRYWAGKTGLLAGKLLREVGRYDESHRVYKNVISLCENAEPLVHIEALNGII